MVARSNLACDCVLFDVLDMEHVRDQWPHRGQLWAGPSIDCAALSIIQIRLILH
jgi:hypothetical protein